MQYASVILHALGVPENKDYTNQQTKASHSYWKTR